MEEIISKYFEKIIISPIIYVMIGILPIAIGFDLFRSNFLTTITKTLTAIFFILLILNLFIYSIKSFYLIKSRISLKGTDQTTFCVIKSLFRIYPVSSILTLIFVSISLNLLGYLIILSCYKIVHCVLSVKLLQKFKNYLKAHHIDNLMFGMYSNFIDDLWICFLVLITPEICSIGCFNVILNISIAYRLAKVIL